jgi:type IV pilus assembly protein PilO
MAESLIAAAWRESRIWPILLAALLLLNIGLYAWITYAFSPEIEALERQFIEARGKAKSAGRQNGVASPRELFEQAGSDLHTFRQAIPARSEFTGLIEEVFSLAGQAGLRIDNIGYIPEIDKEAELLRYGLNFSVAGDYGQIKEFIASLEQSSRIIAIEEISLSGGERQEGAKVNLRIRLATYFKAEGS